jgi:Na+/proline symporter
MSTISTQLNWGTSYIVNDFYKRFVKPQGTEKEFVMVSRLATFVVMLIAMFVTSKLSTMEGAFKFMIESGAGLGLVLIMRWYWWRINAWSEIAATLAPFIPFGIITFYNHNIAYSSTQITEQNIPQILFPHSFFITIIFTTVVWIAVTYLTKPTNLETLEKFYKEIQPSGFWEPIRIVTGLPKPNRNTPNLFLAWFLGIILVYAMLFFIGKLIFGDWIFASVCLIISAFCIWRLNKIL